MTEKLKGFADGLPERRDRKWVDDIKKELDEHATRIEDRVRAFFVKALIALTIVGVACTGSLIGFGYLLHKQSKFTQEIQDQRFEVQLSACLSQNLRHDNVITAINNAVAATPKDQEARAKANAKPFKLILEAAVPYTKDCIAAARVRTRGIKK